MPVVTVRSLRPIDVPFGGRVALLNNFMHQRQRARHHRAAGFGGLEKLFFGHFGGLGMVANEDDLSAFVMPPQEQVQKNEKALGDVLARLIHRAGHIHQAEHGRLRRRHWHPDPVAITQVKGVEKRNMPNPAAKRFNFQLQGRYHVGQAGWQALCFFE